MATKKTLILPDDYPFKEDLKRQAAMIKQTTRSVTVERITVSETTDYLPITFVKVFRNKALLSEFSAAVCRVLVDIIIDLDYNSSTVKLTHNASKLSKPTFYKALLQLTFAGVIRKVKDKKEMYWVNLALLSNGNPVLEG